jgi:hypothetical protein
MINFLLLEHSPSHTAWTWGQISHFKNEQRYDPKECFQHETERKISKRKTEILMGATL